MAGALIVKIPISPSLISAVRVWVRRFNAAPVNRAGDACIKGCYLLLNAHDVDFFIQLSNVSESNELDVQRLKSAAVQAIRNSLRRRKNHSAIRALNEAISWAEKSIPGDLHGVDLSPSPWNHVPGYRMKQVSLL